jgi:hypothetical protein
VTATPSSPVTSDGSAGGTARRAGRDRRFRSHLRDEVRRSVRVGGQADEATFGVEHDVDTVAGGRHIRGEVGREHDVEPTPGDAHLAGHGDRIGRDSRARRNRAGPSRGWCPRRCFHQARPRRASAPWARRRSAHRRARGRPASRGRRRGVAPGRSTPGREPGLTRPSNRRAPAGGGGRGANSEGVERSCAFIGRSSAFVAYRLTIFLRPGRCRRGRVRYLRKNAPTRRCSPTGLRSSPSSRPPPPGTQGRHSPRAWCET